MKAGIGDVSHSAALCSSGILLCRDNIDNFGGRIGTVNVDTYFGARSF